MPSFYWEDRRRYGWEERFPPGCVGHQAWSTQVPFGPAWSVPGLPTRAARPPQPHRVFISHKSGSPDVDRALRIASLAARLGWEYWIDVLDPLATSITSAAALSPIQKAKAIAAVIEMGLLNSDRLIVVYTPATRSSSWVPYEYGRLKSPTLVAYDVAAWVAVPFRPALTSTRLPEYMHLAPLHETESHIQAWLGHVGPPTPPPPLPPAPPLP